VLELLASTAGEGDSSFASSARSDQSESSDQSQVSGKSDQFAASGQSRSSGVTAAIVQPAPASMSEASAPSSSVVVASGDNNADLTEQINKLLSHLDIAQQRHRIGERAKSKYTLHVWYTPSSTINEKSNLTQDDDRDANKLLGSDDYAIHAQNNDNYNITNDSNNGSNNNDDDGDGEHVVVASQDPAMQDAQPPQKKARTDEANISSASIQGVLFLCRSHFYSQECANSQCTSCPFVHYSPPNLTLHGALKTSPMHKGILARCDRAANDRHDGNVPAGGMSMLSYLQVDFIFRKCCKKYSDCVQKRLGEQEAKMSDVMYVVHDNRLLYDRNQGGMSVIGTNKASLKDDRLLLDDDTQQCGLLALSQNCVEEIMGYLSAKDVCVLSRICQGIHRIYDGGSEGYWRTALERRGWPYSVKSAARHGGTDMLSNDGLAKVSDVRSELRQTFIAHFTAIYTALYIASTICAADGQSPTGGIVNNFRRDTGTLRERHCEFTSIDVWSKDVVIAANKRNNTITVYGIDSDEDYRNTTVKTESLCVDPHIALYKIKYDLALMKLTDEYICCHLEPRCRIDKDINRMLVFVSREELSECNVRDTFDLYESVYFRYRQPCMVTVNIRHAVLRYLRTCGEYKAPHLDYVKSDLQRIGSHRDIRISAAGELAACGRDGFLIEVKITWPANDWTDGGERSVCVTRNLVMFSASTGTVTWIGDCSSLLGNSVNHLPERIDVHSCYYTSPSLFALCGVNLLTMMIGELHESVTQDDVNMSLSLLHIPPLEGYRLRGCDNRSVAVLQDCVVSVEQWQSTHGQDADVHTISFFRRASAGEPFVCQSLPIANSLGVDCVVVLSERYVGVLSLRPITDADRQKLYVTNDTTMLLEQIVFDACTAAEVYRVQFPKHREIAKRKMRYISHHKDTVGVCTADGGMAICSKTEARREKRESIWYGSGLGCLPELSIDL
jgi:hypothetical protein